MAMKRKLVDKLYDVDPEELIMRDHLAADRTALANERTFLAYIRTALGAGATGFGLIKLFDYIAAKAIGWIIISFGLIIFGFGLVRFFQFRKKTSALRCAYENKPKDEKIYE